MRVAPIHLLLAALPLFAQSHAPIPSPFAIREEILRKGDAYNAAALMTRLALPAKYSFGAAAKWFKPESVAVEIHSYTSHVYLLELCYSYRRYCRLIAFEGGSLGKPDESWKVRGHIDDYHWYGLEFHTNGDWLVLTRHIAHGTGVGEYDRSWFQLTATGFEELLRNTYRGHTTYADPARSWSASRIEVPVVSQSLDFLYYIRFEPEDRTSPPFEQRRFVSFTRPNGSPRYQLDPARSELTHAEIARFFTTSGRPTPAQIRAFTRPR